jgi:hypothetical protein
VEFEKTGNIEKSSMLTGMCRQTGSKHLANDGKLDVNGPIRAWRTRKSPFETDWSLVAEKLELAPELEGKALFEWLIEERPGKYHDGQLRSFQRETRKWRALNGEGQEVYFPQVHHPGEKMATDFTWMNELEITIAGVKFDHMICHSVLTWSNWECGTVCHSESLLALKEGIQKALFRLGHVPKEHWTDNSTAATHELSEGGKRGFNEKYVRLMAHFGMTPRTINIGKGNENGDVESANGKLKKRAKQHLLLRGHRDFASLPEYKEFLENVFKKANDGRREKLTEELRAMRELKVEKLPEYEEMEVRVTSWSTVNIKRNLYSVPSRLIGEHVRARVYEDRLEISFRGVLQLATRRLVGESCHRIEYRHIIKSLVRKPGAFENYRYKEELFPTLNFRRAYDALLSACSERTANLEYLRILNQAADNMEDEIDEALGLLLECKEVPRWIRVTELVPERKCAVPQINLPPVDLREYDRLLTGGEV